jgi:hypothetical protein
MIPTDARDRPGHAAPFVLPRYPEMTTGPDHAVPSKMISLTPIGPHDPLPSLLPAGYSQAARLFEPGPACAMGWLAGSGPTG